MLKDQGWPGCSGSQPHRRPIVPTAKTPYYVMSKEGSTRSHGSGFLASPARKSGMVQTQVTAQGWLGSTPEGRRPQIRGWRAGDSLTVANSTPATPPQDPDIHSLRQCRAMLRPRTFVRGNEIIRKNRTIGSTGYARKGRPTFCHQGNAGDPTSPALRTHLRAPPR